MLSGLYFGAAGCRRSYMTVPTNSAASVVRRTNDEEALVRPKAPASASAEPTWRRRCAKGAAMALVLFALVSCLNHGWAQHKARLKTASVSQPRQRWQAAAVGGASAWMMCRSADDCISQETLAADSSPLQDWSQPPARLAGAVPSDLATLPGIPEVAFTAASEHWRAYPPKFNGVPVELGDVALFMRNVLASDPFGTGNSIPYVDVHGLGEGKVIAITQRQLAFLVANSLMGNTIMTGDGLTAALKRCSGKFPTPTSFIYSLLSFLAVLSQELAPGAQGTMLIGAQPKPAPSPSVWKDRLASATLAGPTLCGTNGTGLECSLQDFMAGGTPRQALTDIAGGVVGGGGELCDVALTQDESLVQFYPEVLAFAFFVGSADQPTLPKMLPAPWTLLGARRYVQRITGESSAAAGGLCGSVGEYDWLNQQITTVQIPVAFAGKQVQVAANAFVAVASKCSTCLAPDDCPVGDAVNNLCDVQRRHLDDDITLWYQAFESTMYAPSVQEAFRGVVGRVGTGPWGAGVWYGDSQQYFLAVWLATSLLSGSPGLDYYVYDHFCENPGNQCFVLGAEGCAACIQRSAVVDVNRPHAGRCGRAGIRSVAAVWSQRPAWALYEALSNVPPPPDQVFDVLPSPSSVRSRPPVVAVPEIQTTVPPTTPAPVPTPVAQATAPPSTTRSAEFLAATSAPEGSFNKQEAAAALEEIMGNIQGALDAPSSTGSAGVGSVEARQREEERQALREIMVSMK